MESYKEITEAIIGAAIEVHRELGPGKVGLIINFNSEVLRLGIKRLVNGLEE